MFAEDLIAVWVFGSVARGATRSGSDVDVAVLRGRPSTGSLDDLETELAMELERVVGREVDLVVVDGADPDLVHRVLRDGVLVLDRDHPRRIAFEVRQRHAYFDLAPRQRLRSKRPRRARLPNWLGPSCLHGTVALRSSAAGRIARGESTAGGSKGLLLSAA